MLSWERLLRGEVILTLNIVVGLTLGSVVLRSQAASWLSGVFRPLLNKFGVSPVMGLALGVSVGSSRAGAALLASSLDDGTITEHTAAWGTLMLAFPAYLRRWPSTAILAVSMAGLSGAIFALVLLLRSAARFVVLAFVLRGEGRGGNCYEETEAGMTGIRDKPLLRKLRATLPLAWVSYATAFTIVPYAESFLRENLGGYSFLPLVGWTVAAASISHVSAALAIAGGGLAAGSLSNSQAVFALLLGNSLGIVTRALRQNAGYYFGLFPQRLARRMLFMNIATQVPFAAFTLLLAAVPLIPV